MKPVLTNAKNCKFRIITPRDVSFTPRILWIRNCIGANDKQPILFFPTGSVIKFVIQDVAVPQSWHLFCWIYYVHNSHFDVTTSNVSFLRGSNTQLRDVTAGPFTAEPLSDVTPLQCTADPTLEPHGRTRSRGPSHLFWVPIRCHVNSLLQSARLKLLVFVFSFANVSSEGTMGK